MWGFSEIRKLRLEFTEVLVRSCEGSNVVDELRVRTFASEKKRQSHRTVTLVGLQSFKSVVPIQALRWKNEEVGRQQFVSTSCGGTAVYTTIRLSVVSTETTILQLYQSRRNQAHSTAVASSAEGRSSLSACHPEIWTSNSQWE